MTAGSPGFRHQLLLIVVSATVFLTNLGGPPLMDRDEPRNAGCAAEMAARGDWVVPWFNDELREHKPVLLYWLMMSAYAVFGVNEFAARFWSAALAVGTVLMTYHIGRRLFNPAAACWSQGCSGTVSLCPLHGGEECTRKSEDVTARSEDYAK